MSPEIAPCNLEDLVDEVDAASFLNNAREREGGGGENAAQGKTHPFHSKWKPSDGILRFGNTVHQQDEVGDTLQSILQGRIDEDG